MEEYLDFCSHSHSLCTAHILSGECSFEKSRNLPFSDRQCYMSFAHDNHSWDVLSPEATMLSDFVEFLLVYSLTITTKEFTPLESHKTFLLLVQVDFLIPKSQLVFGLAA